HGLSHGSHRLPRRPLLPLGFCFQCHPDYRALHSFPTRRSSDLYTSRGELSRMRGETGSDTRLVRRIQTHSDTGRHVRRSTRVGTDRKSTRLNSSHRTISYAVSCLKKKTTPTRISYVATPGP